MRVTAGPTAGSQRRRAKADRAGTWGGTSTATPGASAQALPGTLLTPLNQRRSQGRMADRRKTRFWRSICQVGMPACKGRQAHCDTQQQVRQDTCSHPPSQAIPRSDAGRQPTLWHPPRSSWHQRRQRSSPAGMPCTRLGPSFRYSAPQHMGCRRPSRPCWHTQVGRRSTVLTRRWQQTSLGGTSAPAWGGNVSQLASRPSRLIQLQTASGSCHPG